MPYEFEANISQLKENLDHAILQLRVAKNFVNDTRNRMNATQDKREKDELRSLIQTAENTVQYWTAQRDDAARALNDSK